MIDSNKKLLQAAAGAAAGGGPLAIEDVFSTYLYTGNGSTQTITNGIDLASEGGLVWVKWRDGVGDHNLVDSNRGKKVLFSNSTTSEADFLNFTVNAFNSNGFTVGSHPIENVSINWSGNDYTSWTFRKAPRFFDVVTWTGAANQTIQHSLNAEPGCIIVKRVGALEDWWVYHRSVATDLNLNLTSAALGYSVISSVTNSSFNVNLNTTTSPDGYVAYLFAHDPLGPSGDGSDGLIACGSYTGGGATDVYVDLGWEPQWVLVKRSDSVEDWNIVDVMRGFGAEGAATNYLEPNTSDAEASSSTSLGVTSTGFFTASNTGRFNASGGTYIYIAIRRGPMRQPTSGTEVFDAVFQTNTSPSAVSGFVTDASLRNYRPGGASLPYIAARLTGGEYLQTHSTAAASTTNDATFDYMDGAWSNFGSSTSDILYYNFRRAPGFFDVVAYAGDGVAGRTVSHNLGVAPEMGIFKVRNNSQYNWNVYLASLGVDSNVTLNSNNASSGGFGGLLFNSTAPTSSEITLGNWAAINAAGNTYIAYLFATLPGVSKVGSYTGNGSSQTINCGFTSGARFILIKRTDSTGDWYVWDTERGIVAANDPHLSLNTTAAEVTTDDSVDPDNSGFIVNQVAATNINVSSASYIYLAIA